ncbi:helix-turn-helix domain-containing protein [Euzebya sp.]|uniref:helix-turn-helix domain-containing protein n=1 Tax=Euzebya sp. TaxID=1971409 RepID=UPI003516579D
MGLAATIIREARSRARLSLREVARRAGTSHATVRRYERGEVDPRMATLERIVAACGYEMRVVLDEPDTSQIRRTRDGGDVPRRPGALRGSGGPPPGAGPLMSAAFDPLRSLRAFADLRRGPQPER